MLTALIYTPKQENRDCLHQRTKNPRSSKNKIIEVRENQAQVDTSRESKVLNTAVSVSWAKQEGISY